MVYDDLARPVSLARSHTQYAFREETLSWIVGDGSQARHAAHVPCPGGFEYCKAFACHEIAGSAQKQGSRRTNVNPWPVIAEKRMEGLPPNCP